MTNEHPKQPNLNSLTTAFSLRALNCVDVQAEIVVWSADKSCWNHRKLEPYFCWQVTSLTGEEHPKSTDIFALPLDTQPFYHRPS
jgi:hypothetical protein